MIDDIKKFLGADWTKYHQVFEDNLKSNIELLDSINEYLLLLKGKQLRPMLCLLAAKACGGISNNAILCAAAIEMLHTATLLHDDVVDEADTRRGNPTIVSLYTPQASVLIGDYWLSRAIHTIIQDCDKAVFQSFARSIEDLSRGEIIQMDKAKKMDTTFDDYRQIIALKTASVFQTAVFSGSYCSGANSEELQAFDNYAYHLGLAFQMRDDILDYHPESITGKPSGQDIKEKKITLPLLSALSKSSAAESIQVKQLIVSGQVQPVVEFVYSKKGLYDAQTILQQESLLAVEALNVIDDSPAKKYLCELASQLNIREM